jgi:ribosomal 50S subunit-recycling heat shock protein
MKIAKTILEQALKMRPADKFLIFSFLFKTRS